MSLKTYKKKIQQKLALNTRYRMLSPPLSLDGWEFKLSNEQYFSIGNTPGLLMCSVVHQLPSTKAYTVNREHKSICSI